MFLSKFFNYIVNIVFKLNTNIWKNKQHLFLVQKITFKLVVLDSSKEPQVLEKKTFLQEKLI